MPKKNKKKKDAVLKELNKIEKEVSSLKGTEKRAVSEEKRIEKEEDKIEKTLFRLGNLTFKRKHLLEIIRGTAGAFLGVGIGMNLINLKNLSTNLPWLNVVGILVFILVISSLLIYKNQKDFIKKEGNSVIFKKLFSLYLIALVVEFIAMWLFNVIPSDAGLMIKMLIIGSYSAMAGAVSFSLI